MQSSRKDKRTVYLRRYLKRPTICAKGSINWTKILLNIVKGNPKLKKDDYELEKLAVEKAREEIGNINIRSRVRVNLRGAILNIQDYLKDHDINELYN